MNRRDNLKLLAPLVAAGIGAGVVLNVPIDLLGLVAKYLILGAATIIGGAYLVLGGIFVGYRGLTKIANLAWGDVFEKHNDAEETVEEDDIPSRRRVYVAWASLKIRDTLALSPSDVSFDEYYTKMTSSLGPEPDSQ